MSNECLLCCMLIFVALIVVAVLTAAFLEINQKADNIFSCDVNLLNATSSNRPKQAQSHAGIRHLFKLHINEEAEKAQEELLEESQQENEEVACSDDDMLMFDRECK
uniref:Uncharacterized protein n=1 Tax=Ditylenchus dipsaci TaxID=166011 RepID=A0A915D0B4_9BILA